MSKKSLIYFCTSLLLCFSLTLGTADAASLKISSFTFNRDSREDVMGPGGALTPDGKPDASFSLAVGGASAIKEITLKNEASGKDGALTHRRPLPCFRVQAGRLSTRMGV